MMFSNSSEVLYVITTLPFFLFFASISTLCPKASDISCSMFKRSVSLFFFVGVVDPFFFWDMLLKSFTVSLFFIILSAAASAFLGSREANNFACPFSICPKKEGLKLLLGVIVILLSLLLCFLLYPWMLPPHLELVQTLFSAYRIP